MIMIFEHLMWKLRQQKTLRMQSRNKVTAFLRSKFIRALVLDLFIVPVGSPVIGFADVKEHIFKRNSGDLL